jgi:outer membrane protein
MNSLPPPSRANRLALLMAAALAAGMLSHAARADDLLQLYEAARAYDPVYQSALRAYDAAVQRTPQARAGLLPSVGLNASVTRNGNNTSLDTPRGAVSDDVNYTAKQASINATQPLYRPANWANYDQAKLAEQIAEATRRQAEQDLIIRVAKAYFDVLAAQDTLTFTRAQKQAVAEQLASAKRNFEVGTATITDTREAQARYDLVTAQEIAAESDLQVKRTALQQLTGKAPPQLKPLMQKPVLPDPSPDSIDAWQQKADQGNYGVIQAQLAEEIAKRETGKAKSGHLPTIDLTASAGQQRQGPTQTVPYSSRTNFNTIGITFNMPLFAGFAVESRVKETLALEDKARNDTLGAKASVEQGTRQTYLGLKSGLAQVKALEAAELSSQVALDANKLGYQVGVRINIDVLNAQSQLYQTKRDLALARYSVLNSGLQLKSLAGALTADDLAQVNALLADPPPEPPAAPAAPPTTGAPARPGASPQTAAPADAAPAAAVKTQRPARVAPPPGKKPPAQPKESATPPQPQ